MRPLLRRYADTYAGACRRRVWSRARWSTVSGRRRGHAQVEGATTGTSPRRSPARARSWLAGLAAAARRRAGLVAVAPRRRRARHVNAQLSLAGVDHATTRPAAAPIGVHPGDTVDFNASAVPTAGLDKLGTRRPARRRARRRGTTFQVTADFADLPGGAPEHRAHGGTATSDVHASAGKGTYSFTWTAQTVVTACSAPSIGRSTSTATSSPQAGVKLNAEQPVRRHGRGRQQPAAGRHLGPAARACRSPRACRSSASCRRSTCPACSLPTVRASVPEPAAGGDRRRRQGSTHGTAKAARPAPTSSAGSADRARPWSSRSGDGGGGVPAAAAATAAAASASGGGGRRATASCAAPAARPRAPGAGRPAATPVDRPRNGAPGGRRPSTWPSSPRSPSGQLPVLLRDPRRRRPGRRGAASTPGSSCCDAARSRG